MSVVRVSWADHLFSFLGMRRRREGWVEAGTGLPGVGSRAREWDSKGTIEVEVLGFEE